MVSLIASKAAPPTLHLIPHPQTSQRFVIDNTVQYI